MTTETPVQPEKPKARGKRPVKGGVQKARNETLANLNRTQVYPSVIVPADVEKKVEYQHVVNWIALPTSYREEYLGWECSSEKALAKKLGINEWTINKWKNTNELWAEVFKLQKQHLAYDMGDVLLGLKRAAIATGKAPEVKLYAQIAGAISEADKIEHNISPEVKKALEVLSGVLPD
jgi:hypothetical protein